MTAELHFPAQYPDDWYMYVLIWSRGVDEEKHPAYVPAVRLSNESTGGAASAIVAAVRSERSVKACAARAEVDGRVDGIVAGRRRRSAPKQGGRESLEGASLAKVSKRPGGERC